VSFPCTDSEKSALGVIGPLKYVSVWTNLSTKPRSPQQTRFVEAVLRGPARRPNYAAGLPDYEKRPCVFQKITECCAEPSYQSHKIRIYSALRGRPSGRLVASVSVGDSGEMYPCHFDIVAPFQLGTTRE